MKQVQLYGLGGQGVVTASKILAQAIGIHDGQWAVAIPSYGHERRGAPVYAGLMIDFKPIKVRSFVYEPDYVVVFDPTLPSKGVDITAGVKPDSILVMNSSDLPPEAIRRHFTRTYYADATSIAVSVLNRDVPNSAMLGLLASTGLTSLDSVCAALEDAFEGKDGGANAGAARECFRASRVL